MWRLIESARVIAKSRAYKAGDHEPMQQICRYCFQRYRHVAGQVRTDRGDIVLAGILPDHRCRCKYCGKRVPFESERRHTCGPAIQPRSCLVRQPTPVLPPRPPPVVLPPDVTYESNRSRRVIAQSCWSQCPECQGHVQIRSDPRYPRRPGACRRLGVVAARCSGPARFEDRPLLAASSCTDAGHTVLPLARAIELNRVRRQRSGRAQRMPASSPEQANRKISIMKKPRAATASRRPMPG